MSSQVARKAVAKGVKSKAKKGSHLRLVTTNKKKSFMTEKARQQLIVDHMTKGRHIAHSLLKRWRSRLDPAEVDSIVDLSLCEAAARFNPSKGVSFVTFLFYHLKGNLVRLVIESANRHFIPVSELEACEGLESWHHKMSSQDAAEALRREPEVAPDQALLQKELTDVTARICAKLSEVEKEIVHRVFVLEEQVLDVAEALGYSRCHVSRIKTRALELLQRELNKIQGYESASRREDEETEDGSRPKLKLIKPRRARREATMALAQMFAA